MTTSRREFVAQLGAMTLLGHTVARGAPTQHADPDTAADAPAPWYRRTLRWGQTNITEKMMLGGPIKFSAEGQNEEIGSACIQNLNQRPTVVLPAKSAEHKPVFPMPGWGKV